MTLRHYIAGEFVDPAAGRWLDLVSPSRGEKYADLARGDRADVDRAVQAAQRAFPIWSGLRAEKRSELLLRVAALIEERFEQFAQAETKDNGKPIALSQSVDIPRAIQNFRFFAGAILHAATEAHQSDAAVLNITLRKPRGVVGLISPWNLPIYLLTWKVAPALATGNTVVVKPSELTPLTATMLAELFSLAGIPAGVFNVVHGLGAEAGAAIVEHPEVRTLSFTGGTTTGRAIATAAAPHFKKLALEMGGKNPFLIFADADRDKAIDSAAKAAFTNQGQICLCGSRLLVERSCFDEVVRKLVDAARRLRVGDPFDPATEQGALVSAAHRDKVLSYLALARQEGGKIECGGGVPASLPKELAGGYYVEPTVITGLGPNCRVNQEEIFGPVVSVIPFESEEQAIHIANSTPYGLAATVWTENLSRAHRLGYRLEAGTIWVNCWLLRDLRVPFGGVKQSGMEKEGGIEALRFFTEAQNLCIRIGESAR